MSSRRSKSEVSGDPPTTHPLAVTPPDHLPRQTCRFVHSGTVSRKVVLYGPRTVPQVVHTRTLTAFVPLVSHLYSRVRKGRSSSLSHFIRTVLQTACGKARIVIASERLFSHPLVSLRTSRPYGNNSTYTTV